VLYAESDQDLIQAVKLAKEKDWQIAIRSGGHSWAAWSVREGSLLIDLSLMQEVSLDQASGIATVRPAVKGGEVLDPWLAEHDLFPDRTGDHDRIKYQCFQNDRGGCELKSGTGRQITDDQRETEQKDQELDRGEHTLDELRTHCLRHNEEQGGYKPVPLDAVWRSDFGAHSFWAYFTTRAAATIQDVQLMGFEPKDDGRATLELYAVVHLAQDVLYARMPESEQHFSMRMELVLVD
jgi:hypothetical protein